MATTARINLHLSIKFYLSTSIQVCNISSSISRIYPKKAKICAHISRHFVRIHQIARLEMEEYTSKSKASNSFSILWCFSIYSNISIWKFILRLHKKNLAAILKQNEENSLLILGI